MVPVTLTFNTCSHCARGISSNGLFSSVAKIDALLINTSTRPHFSMTASTMASTEDSSATSTLTRQTGPAGLVDLLDDCLRLGEVEVGHHDDGSGGGELSRQFTTDALAGAGHDDHSVHAR